MAVTEEQTLAVLRAAERTLQTAWRWIPYTDELESAPEKMKQARYTDASRLTRDAQLIRKHLKEAEQAVLNIAETRGSK